MAQSKYTRDELDQLAIDDLIADAKHSEEQAANGPYYPDKGIIRESLLAYASWCRERAARYKTGGAHKFLMTGNTMLMS